MMLLLSWWWSLLWTLDYGTEINENSGMNVHWIRQNNKDSAERLQLLDSLAMLSQIAQIAAIEATSSRVTV